MAGTARGIALGRIIEWFKTCDIEEGHFAIHRGANVLQQRTPQAQMTEAPKPAKVRKPRWMKAKGKTTKPVENAAYTQQEYEQMERGAEA